MTREYRFHVSSCRAVRVGPLYICMTNNLRRRVWQHKAHAYEGFTSDYDAVRLVYWESFDDVHDAITREKQLKRWRREKKTWLIRHQNPTWQDLAAEWYETQGPSTRAEALARDDRFETTDES